MLDTSVLKSALSRAAQEGQALDLGHPQDCLTRLIDQIDAVVLPRDIALDNGAHQTLSLTVKSRRLIRVNGPVPRALGALPGVADAELTGQSDQLVALAHLMTAFSAHATQLTVSVTDPAQAHCLNELGLSAEDLKRGLLAAGYSLPNQAHHDMAALETLAAAHGLDWAKFDGDGPMDPATTGDTHLKIWDTVLPYLLKVDRPAAGKIAAWLIGQDHGPRVGIAVKDTTCLIALVPAAATQAWIAASSGR